MLNEAEQRVLDAAIRIKPWGSGPGEWTNQILLVGAELDNVTDTWLEARAREWLADRDKDVAAGNLD